MMTKHPPIDWRVVIGVVLLVGCVLYATFLGPSPPKEPNICSLEYREAYLRKHDSDEALRRECPYEPWYRKP
jgi:hypothetical protein